ncbi:3-deoxy-D-manno-octulosonic acid transferase [Octadecabacter sp. CECT 8868]|uniref:3-deoxy-D-manno-octulosonic acid transferase n=1 Tax=Octadecabacter algicola TaxID=2909342 RepID=UPI001F4708BD|nr:glycosyltransferase N-terminal domain-containing protein [Octadecabacter algicola]MCF2905265.1 3-deoxy-D-manno-octulosonic acid transferase [Octadecabacter algicola]
MTSKPRIGPMLRLVLGVGWLLAPFARPLLKRRLAKGKEDPARWSEKLGEATMARPDGPLVWMHGVGVGEVMALRGLIDQLAETRPDLQFLVTSSARSSGEVFAKNLPANTRHQYLPLDLPKPVNDFLDHWKPDLAIWSDQEIWPRMAVTCARRGIPQAYVAARITKASAKAKSRFGSAYGDLFRLLDTRHAQDAGTAAHMAALMADDTPVKVSGSLKAAGAALVDDPAARAAFEAAVGRRSVWVAASAHPADIERVLEVQYDVRREGGKDWLLVIAPRRLEDAALVENGCRDFHLSFCHRSHGVLPDETTDVYIADTFSELGLWYRSSFVTLIGGTFEPINGHNPWEAVALDCPVLHGPYVENFRADFSILDEANAAVEIGRYGSDIGEDVGDMISVLNSFDLAGYAKRAHAVRSVATDGLTQIVADLLGLLRG